MTVNETKVRIESELQKIKEGFGNASDYVSCSVQISENEIDGAPTDITYIFGSLAIGKPGAGEDEKLYLPLDAELDDDDNVDEAQFEKNLGDFVKIVEPIRARLCAAENLDTEVEAIIAEFDKNVEQKYNEEIERLNRIAKKNLITAGLAAALMLVIATIIMVIDKLA